MQISIRSIGNSRGVVIPKPVLAQAGFDDGVHLADLTVENGAIVLRRPRAPVREGWAEAAMAIGERGEDALVMGEFANADDAGSVW